MSVKNIFSLAGKTVVITGGAGHLGSGMSEALAAFGADLFILGRNPEKNFNKAIELKAKYDLPVCESLIIDLNDGNSIDHALNTVVEKTGRIDVLINNAAYSCPKPVENFSYDEWCRGIDGTINGTFRVTQSALRHMLAQDHTGGGWRSVIINIASMYGMVAPDMSIYGDSGQNNPANYGAGKAAIIQFTKYLASVYGSKGIRANAVSPGPFPNPTVQKDKRFIGELCRKNPLHRIGTPEDLQGIIIFLASDASSYVNGQNIAVDGGWTAW